MKNLFFILLILPNFAYTQNPDGLPIEEAEFNGIKYEIIHILKSSVENPKRLNELNKIIEKNESFLFQESNKKFLIEFVNSAEFQDVALKAVIARPMVSFTVISMEIIALVSLWAYISESNQSSFLMSLFGLGAVSYGSVLAFEKFVDLLIMSKIGLPSRSRGSVTSRANSWCKRVFFKKKDGFKKIEY